MSWADGMEAISNNAETIDSREIIARIEYLEGRADDEDQDEPLDDDEREELEALKALAEQCQGYGDWDHGETLIRDDHFEEYAQQLAEDIGAINTDASWPNNCIDWEKAADELKVDYMTVDFDGVEYLMRA